MSGKTPNLNSVYAHLKRLSSEFMADSLMSGMDKLDDEIFQLANSAISNSEQTRLFDAMRELRLQRENFSKFMAAAVEKLFNDPGLPVTFEPGPSQNQLAVLQDEELELKVVVETSISATRADNAQQLLLLCERLNHLLRSRNPPLRSTEIPIGPEKLLSTLGRGVLLLQLESKEKLHTLNVLCREFSSNYPTFVETANRYLVTQGILPELHFRAGTAGTDSVTGSNQQKPTNSRNSSSDHRKATTGNDFEDNLLNEVRDLLAQMRDRLDQRATQATQEHARAVFTADELIDTLNSYQQKYAEDDGNLKGRVINLQSLLSSVRNSKNKTLSEGDEDLINLVSMLFEFILDDYNLSPPIQVLISRLQIPIVKIVLKDQTFFNQPNHPARRLLNILAKAGIGWNNEQDAQKDKLYQQIDKTVKTILNEFTGDLQLLEALYRDFEHFLSREAQRASLIEARTKEAEIGRIRSQQAQKAVKQIVRALTQNSTLPSVAMEILHGGWSRVMFLAYLRDHDKNTWKDAVHTAELLVWCLEPKISPEEREEWKQVAPTLLAKLKRGLNEVSNGADKTNAQIEALKEVLRETFRHSEFNSVKSHSTLQAAPSVVPDSITPENTEHSRDQIDLKPGDWIEYSLMNGNHFRCKLSAIIEEADSYIFVNRMGLKVLERSSGELLQDMNESRVRLLQQGMLIDRALDAVVHNLRRLSAKRA